ncbi:MAG: 1,4-dihydroxy-2-naphthoate octaprenyltransferase [Candidatus Omnitrophica bacterium]|nr:1,4-dihydroxy-2-naphthoate octaprenyltransferase [Candidatus Omnitrophota bacterium]
MRIHTQKSVSLFIGHWIQAIRPFAFTASIIPVTLGAVFAFAGPYPIRWELFPLVLVCALFFHAGTNLVNDYYDFTRGIDTLDSFGSSRILPEHKLTPRQIHRSALFCFGCGFGLGIILVIIHGLPMLGLGMIGLLGGYFYTARPVEYKYRALGDIFVFILMGPLMVIGSFFALTGTYHPGIFYVSLPIGFLVTAILHANNLRDIDHDRQARIKTFANMLGHRNAQIEYLILIGGAYLSVLILIISRTISLWGILVFLSVPVALKNIMAIEKSKPHTPQDLAAIDKETAKLHFLFGALMIVSFYLETIIT